MLRFSTFYILQRIIAENVVAMLSATDNEIGHSFLNINTGMQASLLRLYQSVKRWK